MTKAALLGCWILVIFLGSASGQTPRVISAASPGYPLLPSGTRESGEVRVEISIDTFGHVIAAKAQSGPQKLGWAAERAALRWRFGTEEPLPAKRVITFGFNLQPNLGNPPPIQSVNTPPDRIDVFAEEKKLSVIADPPVVKGTGH